MRLLLAPKNQATRRNEIIKSYLQLQLGSSSNRYAPACPNKKQNHLQNRFLRRTQFCPENLLKTGFAQKALPSCPSGRHKQKWDRKIAKSTAKADPRNEQKWQLRSVKQQAIDLEQRKPAHAKPDFNWLSGPRWNLKRRTYGILCPFSGSKRRLQCSTTQTTFTNPSLLSAAPLLRAMF